MKVVPGSSKTQLGGTLDDMLKVKIAAPPEKGKANKEIINYLAKIFKTDKENVKIISGANRELKLIKIKVNG